MRYFVRMTEDDTDFQVMEDIYNNARAAFWAQQGYSEIGQFEYHELRRECDMSRQEEIQRTDLMAETVAKIKRLFKK